MGCRGVHFALTDNDVQSLKLIHDEEERIEYLLNVVEEEYFSNHPEHLAESDKSWEAMHRALANGEMLWDGADYPLDHVVFGGESLYAEPDYIMHLKSPEQVRDIAAALPAITKDDFRQRYYAIDADDYGFPMSDEDLDYTWESFQAVRELYLRAASEGRFILFTVDQ